MNKPDKIIRNIESGKYNNLKPRPSSLSSNLDLPTQKRLVAEYLDETTRLHRIFFDDCLSELDLQDHPKAEIFCQLCWQEGLGYRLAWMYMQKWVELLR